MNVAIANKLVNLRKRFGFSQEDLAAKLGVSRQAVSNGSALNLLQIQIT